MSLPEWLISNFELKIDCQGLISVIGPSRTASVNCIIFTVLCMILSSNLLMFVIAGENGANKENVAGK